MSFVWLPTKIEKIAKNRLLEGNSQTQPEHLYTINATQSYLIGHVRCSSLVGPYRCHNGMHLDTARRLNFLVGHPLVVAPKRKCQLWLVCSLSI